MRLVDTWFSDHPFHFLFIFFSPEKFLGKSADSNLLLKVIENVGLIGRSA